MTVYHDTPGWCYILCFDRPLGNIASTRGQASHYLGYAVDLPRRLATHASGRGVPITQAAVARLITWQVYYRPGTPELERWLKASYKRTPCLCPSCAAARGRRPAYGFQPLDQMAFPQLRELSAGASEDFDFPAPPAVRMDGYEIATLRRWRLAVVLPAVELDYVDTLI